MRKFLTNGAFIGALIGVIPTARRASRERRPWAAGLQWVAWGVALALAIAAVLDARDDAREDPER